MARMGRPVVNDEAKSKGLHIRVTPSEMKRLEEISRHFGISKTDAILKALSVLEKTIKK